MEDGSFQSDSYQIPIIVMDPDEDYDGALGWDDNCPGTYNPYQFDTDEDGLGDECDNDDDGDGLCDSVDPWPTSP